MVEPRSHFLSVVIPVFRQGKTIAKDLKKIRLALDSLRYDYEIVVVIDGLVDKSFENAKKTKSSKIKVYGYRNNHGKGYAVRYGMARARGDIIAFIDAGMEIDPNGISMILEHMEWYDADIIVGSKRHPASQINYPQSRRIISFLYQMFIRFFAGFNVRDTQAGLKIFKRKVLEDVLPRLLVKRYAFDLEMLAVAWRLGYKRIFEAPIKISYNFDDLTHASTLLAMKNTLQDTLAVIYRLRILRYYDDGNKRKWRFDPDLNFKVNI